MYIFADIFFNSMILCLMTSGSEVSENTLLASEVIDFFSFCVAVSAEEISDCKVS